MLEIVDRLTEELDIPVFHDDQHGTAIVTLAALNALRFTKRKPEDRLGPFNIVPDVTDPRIQEAVNKAVRSATG